MAQVKGKINYVVDAQGALNQLLPYTSADVVSITAISGLSATTVQDALAEIYAEAQQGGVTGVKGNAESTYRTGNVNITKANIGLGNVDNTADADKHVAYATQAQRDAEGHVFTAYYATQQGVQDAQATADDALAIATSKSSGYSFDTYDDMVTALKSAAKGTYHIGDSLFIKEANTPDYWVSDIYSTNTGTYGYYGITEMESDIDLSAYQTKQDNSLQTSIKTVVGAINYLNQQSTVHGNSITNLQQAVGQQATAITNLQTDVGDISNLVLSADSLVDALNNATRNITANATNILQVINGTQAAGKANRLSTAYPFSLTGDVSAPAVNFNGTAGVTLQTTLSNSGVTAGSYSAVTVNAKGIVTAGGTSIEVGTAATPSANLMVGGLYIQTIS